MHSTHIQWITSALALSSGQEKTRTYSVIVARADPPLKGTHFRTEQKGECKIERGRQTKGAWGGLVSWWNPFQLTANHSILRERPEEINLPPFHGNTKVKHALRNPKVKPYPQGGQGTQPQTPVLCDIDNCPPTSFTKRDTDTWGQPVKDIWEEDWTKTTQRKEQSKELSKCPEWGSTAMRSFQRVLKLLH